MADVEFKGSTDHSTSVATITLTGGYEIFRFCVNMLNDQIEFYAAGRQMLVELREHLTPARFDPMAKSLLGDERYGKLAQYFEREQFCCACDKNLTGNRKRHPAGGFKSYCSACKKVADRA